MDGRSASSIVLRNLRHRKQLTQRALAERSGVPQPTIAEIEAGRREPTMSLLSRIAESVGETLQVRTVPLPRFSAVATANQIAERLTVSSDQVASPASRKDSALRSLLDLRDALRRCNEEEFLQLTEQPPSLVGDTRWDALIAGVVEDESTRRNVSPPRWTNDQSRFTKPFWYLAEIPELHDWELAGSPASFIRHGVLASESELESI